MRNRLPRVCLCLALSLGMSSLCLAADQPGARAKRAPRARAAAPAQYDVLHQVHMPTFADALAAQIKKGIQKDIAAKKPGESEEDYALRKQFAENVQAGLVRFITQADNVSLGWKLDRKQVRTYLDLTVTALPGSDLARQFAQAKEVKTAFAGFFVPGAALTVRGAGQVPKAEAAANVKFVELLRENGLKKNEKDGVSDDEKNIRKDLWNKLMDVVRDSAASGRSDGALSVTVHEKGITLVSAGYTADGAKLESVVKPVAEYLHQRAPIGELKLDAEKCEGVNLHTFAIPAPPGGDREKFVQVFGETLDVVLGFGKEAVYLAAGKDAMKALKEAIRKSAQPVALASPLEASLSLKPIADFVAVMGKDREKEPAKMAADVLGKQPGKDQVKLVVEPIERGVIVRFDVQAGVLDLLGAINPDVKRFLEGK